LLNWFVGLLVCWFVVWFVGLLSGGLSVVRCCWSIVGSIAGFWFQLVDGCGGLLVGWLVGLLVGWLVGLLVGWLVGCGLLG
jgi:hypothetical protein